MTNRHKAKGDRFELAITEHVNGAGVEARRTRAGYERDYGDIHLAPGVAAPLAILQCKNERRIDLAGYVRATEAQRLEAGAEHGATVVKRPGVAAPGEQYVVLTLDGYLKLVKAVTEAARRVTQGGIPPRPVDTWGNEHSVPAPETASYRHMDPAQRVTELRALRRPDGGDAA